MGRVVKRVALDFNWPLEKVWKGYICPYTSENCSACDGLGYSTYARHLRDLWWGYAPFEPKDRGVEPWVPNDHVIWNNATAKVARNPEFYGSGEGAVQREATRLAVLFNGLWQHNLNQADVDVLWERGDLRCLTHVLNNEGAWIKKDPLRKPTVKEVRDCSVANSLQMISEFACIEAECKSRGENVLCNTCSGECSVWISEEMKALSDAWEPIEPPIGEGYQLWETVSSGSPFSPVFESASELAKWLSSHYKKSVNQGLTVEQWVEFIEKVGWSPSAASFNGKFTTGVETMLAG